MLALLCLLVFRRFEFCGLKCAEAGWLLEFSFKGISIHSTAVTLDTDIAICVQNLSFGGSGTSTLAPWKPFWQLGDNLGDHGSSRKVTWESRITFLMIWG